MSLRLNLSHLKYMKQRLQGSYQPLPHYRPPHSAICNHIFMRPVSSYLSLLLLLPRLCDYSDQLSQSLVLTLDGHLNYHHHHHRRRKAFLMNFVGFIGGIRTCF
ncbi:hypothetical protein Hdeb2414_s0004g00149871 [Helianthus debilis subsp. tardiflorus]